MSEALPTPFTLPAARLPQCAPHQGKKSNSKKPAKKISYPGATTTTVETGAASASASASIAAKEKFKSAKALADAKSPSTTTTTVETGAASASASASIAAKEKFKSAKALADAKSLEKDTKDLIRSLRADQKLTGPVDTKIQVKCGEFALVFDLMSPDSIIGLLRMGGPLRDEPDLIRRFSRWCNMLKAGPSKSRLVLNHLDEFDYWIEGGGPGFWCDDDETKLQYEISSLLEWQSKKINKSFFIDSMAPIYGL